MSDQSTALPPHYRWNFATLVVDYVSYWATFTFISLASVLPAFVRQLTASPLAVGALSAIFTAGLFLPQLAFARLISGKPRKKPYWVITLSVRLVFPLLSVALYAGLGRYPQTMLTVFFIGMGLYAFSDGAGSVPWTDILARAIPARRRGRLYGIAQVISGVLRIGVGALVGLVLGRLHFPANYALLFALASIAYIPSTVALWLMKEPPPEHSEREEHTSPRHSWLNPILGNVTFRRYLACRLLLSVIDMAIPFYVGHAQDVLHLPERAIGAFIIAQTLAAIGASIVFGAVNERHGSHVIIRYVTLAGVAGPLYALLAHLTGAAVLVWAYPFVYAMLGIVNAGFIMGFLNYLLEIAPAGERPTYIGATSVIMSVATVIPLAGGWLLRATSYGVLFGLATALIGLSAVLSFSLNAPHNEPPAPRSSPHPAGAPDAEPTVPSSTASTSATRAG